jgi:Co/Zn/Cd efflux system component
VKSKSCKSKNSIVVPQQKEVLLPEKRKVQSKPAPVLYDRNSAKKQKYQSKPM